jgi:hypothetical protein
LENRLEMAATAATSNQIKSKCRQGEQNNIDRSVFVVASGAPFETAADGYSGDHPDRVPAPGFDENFRYHR